MKIGLGAPVYEGEVDLLPDPILFRDALLLAGSTAFPGSAADLDATDARLLDLVRRLRRAMAKGR